ncbi:uncharacterized protein LOC142234090 [Haematobia irritans]|uniref:uncharacterized protein LOC142234090 n=1 Tax=Haematobia irritans TaxID=7368 RepID=UPI003F4FF2DC
MHVYNFRHIKDVLTNLIVEYMHLNVAIYSDEDGYNCKDYRRDNIDGIRYMEVEEDITDQNFKNDICQELEIGHFLKNEDFLTFSQNYLSSYPNLNSLTIGGYMFSSTINIDHKLINQISKYCSRLKKIKISGCMIDEFVSFPNLEELTLEACKGLTWIQLKQILSEMNLKSFSSFRTKYSGKHHSISVSQSLEYLDLDLEENDFSLLFNHKLANMKSLIWHTGLNHCQCQDIPTIIPNIQVLKLCHIDAADTNSFFHLKALTTLTFEKCPEIRELLKLLQHSNLKYLALESNPDDLVKFPRSLDRGVIRSMPTTLTHLKIPLNVFKFLQDFCFDLLSSNRNLILTITLSYNRPVDEEFMINMITSKKFPTRIKSLQICGLNIDFADFLNYFPVIMKKIEIVSTMLLSSPQQQTMVLYEK